jgi:hypothetical protein
VQGLSEQAVEERAGRTRLERGPHLAEDLAFARDHRVEPGRHAEQVQCSRLVVEPVERRARGIEHARSERLRLIGVLGRDVELRAVAGREAHGLARRLGQLVRHLTRTPRVECDPLPQLHGGAVV